MEAKPRNYDKVIKEWKADADEEMLGIEPGSYEYNIQQKAVLKKYRKIDDVYQYLLDTYPISRVPWGIWVPNINDELGGGITKVLIILKYLYNHSLSKDDGLKFLNDNKCDPKWQNSMIFYCDDYNEMCENLKDDNLDIKPRSVHRYLRWLKDNEFILVVRHFGKSGKNIYSIGDWISHKGIPKKRLYFVQQHSKGRKKDFGWRKYYENAFRSFKESFPLYP